MALLKAATPPFDRIRQAPNVEVTDPPLNLYPVKQMVILDAGLLSYEEALERQQSLVLARKNDQIPDTLLLLEHPKTITLGRGAQLRNLLHPEAFAVHSSERGGDVTLHAPGQLVGYMIRLLPPGKRDLHAHLRLLETLIIEAMAAFGLAADRCPGKTGVWVKQKRKIASLGVACRHWVTYHGFAWNIDNDLQDFQAINPCGFAPEVMTSVTREAGRPCSIEEAKRAVMGAVERLANIQGEPAPGSSGNSTPNPIP